jgi:hypothetical protein
MANNAGLPIQTYLGSGLVPARLKGDEVRLNISLPAGVFYPLGTVLGQVPTGAAQATADVQTFTSTGGAGTGNLVLQFGNSSANPQVTLASTATAAVAQAAINAAIGIGNCTFAFTSGSTIGGSGAAFTLTFGGTWAGLVPLVTIVTQLATATYAGVHTTPGTNATAGVVANDTQVATITGTPTGGGVYAQFAGQTSALIPYNATAAQVATALIALSNIGNNAAALPNVAVTGGAWPGTAMTITFQNQCGGLEQPLISWINALAGGTTPAIATLKTVVGSSPTGHWAAYTGTGANDGRQIAKALLEWPCAVDTYGNITFGSAVGIGDNAYSQINTTAWLNGIFNTADLTGLDANAVTQLGRLISGTTASIGSTSPLTLIDIY